MKHREAKKLTPEITCLSAICNTDGRWPPSYLCVLYQQVCPVWLLSLAIARHFTVKMENQTPPALPAAGGTSNGLHINDRPIIGKSVGNVCFVASALERATVQTESDGSAMRSAE
jgi:hypothetical protein